MSTVIECDRCGYQETVVRGTLTKFVMVELRTKVGTSTEEGELCDKCQHALKRFMERLDSPA